MTTSHRTRTRTLAVFAAVLAAALCALGATRAAHAQPSFINFESGQVRPLAM